LAQCPRADPLAAVQEAALWRDSMVVLSKAIFPIISFLATVVLTLIATYIVHLDDKGAYLVFATGTSISLA
jgi:hypothetical protein